MLRNQPHTAPLAIRVISLDLRDLSTATERAGASARAGSTVGPLKSFFDPSQTASQFYHLKSAPPRIAEEVDLREEAAAAASRSRRRRV